MPKSNQKNWRGTVVTFREVDHSYNDEAGRKYVSVSSLVKQAFDQFDAVAMSQRMQEQGKGKAEELRARWAQTAADACQYGTRVHEAAEAALRGERAPHKAQSDKERLAMQYVADFAKTAILGNLEVLAVEAMIFSQTFEVAGTADLICRNRDGAILVLDWKTNKQISETSEYGKAAINGLEHLPDCEVSRYALQLSLYQRLIEFEGMFPAGTKFERAILHVNPDAHEGVKVIKLPYLRLEVSHLLLGQMVRISTPF